MNPFDFINEINDTKEQIIVDDITEKAYNPFLTNRQLSYFYDTTLLANEMNIKHQIDHKLQFDFLLNTVRRKKRFSKWFKQEQQRDVEVVKEYYGYSNEKARNALKLLSEEQLKSVAKKVRKGGRR